MVSRVIRSLGDNDALLQTLLRTCHPRVRPPSTMTVCPVTMDVPQQRK
jgi:hypothetical protein